MGFDQRQLCRMTHLFDFPLPPLCFRTVCKSFMVNQYHRQSSACIPRTFPPIVCFKPPLQISRPTAVDTSILTSKQITIAGHRNLFCQFLNASEGFLDTGYVFGQLGFHPLLQPFFSLVDSQRDHFVYIFRALIQQSIPQLDQIP